MKMKHIAWFKRSRILPEGSAHISATVNDWGGENYLRSELFSTPQLERFGKKLARTHKLSPEILPYYLLKRLTDNETIITRCCYLLNAGKKNEYHARR